MFGQYDSLYARYRDETEDLQKKLDDARKYIAELEKMYNATLILQTNNLNFEKMLELVPEMAALRKEALG